ncbi:MAG: FAD-binding oxidoreductase [Gemmatimonadaceae bacterium]
MTIAGVSGSGEGGARALPNVAATSREAWQQATIESITLQTPTVKSFRLHPLHWRPFLAGQHVDVRLTAPDGYVAQRSYSVTSSPDDDGVIELAIEELREGEVSPYFHEVAQVGDTVEVRGPFAEHFVWRPSLNEGVLLVGGGSGMAPFMSMVRQRARLIDAPPMVLVYSVRSWEDIIYREELFSHEREQRGLQLVLCLTRDAVRRPNDFARRVDADILMQAIALLPAPPAISYVCGRNSFVDVVAEALVGLGAVAASVRTERYGGR